MALYHTLPISNNSWNCDSALTATSAWQAQLYVNVDFPNINWVKSNHKSRLKLEPLYALLQVSLCALLMKNMDWAKKFGTWKSTKKPRALPLELDDEQVHYVGI